ncbi:MAG: hypothetical protein HND48_12025 [Chloroflexi bacterium]|nr:hypothetical protein [Chloroflexota bacterium]
MLDAHQAGTRINPWLQNHTNILLRPMTLPDFTDVHRLIREFDESSIGHAGLTLEEMRSDWLGRARFGAGTRRGHRCDAKTGETVGFSAVFEYRDPPVRPFLWGVVAPPYRGAGDRRHSPRMVD